MDRGSAEPDFRRGGQGVSLPWLADRLSIRIDRRPDVGAPVARSASAPARAHQHGAMIGRSTAITEPLVLPRGSVRTLRRAAAATVVARIALVGTGGWVRLSDSGLGCATWPSCFADDFVARGTYHSLVEFINRCMIIAVGVLVVVTLTLAVWPNKRSRGAQV